MEKSFEDFYLNLLHFSLYHLTPLIPEPIITPVLYESSSLSDFQPESFKASLPQ